MKKSALKALLAGSAEFVMAHGKRQKGRNRQPSACFLGITNPRKALTVAEKLLRMKQQPQSPHSDYDDFKKAVQGLLDENRAVKTHQSLLWEDRIIFYQPVYNLIQRFEKDILYDCHSLGAKVSRSRVGREILRRGLNSIGLMARNLQGWRLKEEDVRQALIMLLQEIGRMHNLTDMPDSRHDFNGWVVWTRIHSNTQQ